LKSGSINRLEPSGPVQACNGIAFNVGKHLPFSTVVTGIVTTVFRSLTVSENYCFEVVSITKQWHSMPFIDLDLNIRLLILLSIYIFEDL
jgi:hypothetical protein